MHNQYQPPAAGQPPSQPSPPLEPTPSDPLPAPPPSSTTKHSSLRSVLSTVGVFLLAPILALLLTAFVFQSYEVDGPSMETTLQNQDRLIVYKLPKTWARVWGNDYIPARGEVVVFTRHASDQFSGEADKQLIKRVIGVPGDRVVIKSGDVRVFNEQNPDGFDPDTDQAYAESVATTSGNIDMTVKEGEVFVLGDNRDNSLDSRVFGPIKASDISGTLVLRIYPFNKFDAY